MKIEDFGVVCYRINSMLSIICLTLSIEKNKTIAAVISAVLFLWYDKMVKDEMNSRNKEKRLFE